MPIKGTTERPTLKGYDHCARITFEPRLHGYPWKPYRIAASTDGALVQYASPAPFAGRDYSGAKQRDRAMAEDGAGTTATP